MTAEFQNTISECTAFDGSVEDTVETRFGKLPEYSKISTRKCIYPIATLAVVSGLSLAIAAMAFSEIKQLKRDLQLDSATFEFQRQEKDQFLTGKSSMFDFIRDNIMSETKELKVQVDEVKSDNETLHRQMKEVMTDVNRIAQMVTQLQSSNSQLQNAFSQTKALLSRTLVTAEKAFFRMSGWEVSGNLVYKFFSDAVTYATAKRRCLDNGGRLASKIWRDGSIIANINSKGLVRGTPYIGYDDIGGEGHWQWSDGGSTNSQTTRWARGQPDDWKRNEDCCVIHSNTRSQITINDVPCQHRYGYICEVDLNI